jgi:type III secretion protein L
MSSSERVLRGHGVTARSGSVARGPATSPVAASIPARAVLRGTGGQQGGIPRRPTSETGDFGTADRHPAARRPEPESPATLDLRRLHAIAERRGFAAGEARAERRLDAAIAAVGALAARLEADAPAERAVLARWVTDVSLSIARRILGDAVRSDPTTLVGAIERTLSATTASPEVRILVHPSAVALVRAGWEAAHGAAYLGKRWTFEADPTLPPAGCLVRYQHGLVDVGIDAQLDAVAAALDTVIDGGDLARSAEVPQ